MIVRSILPALAAMAIAAVSPTGGMAAGAAPVCSLSGEIALGSVDPTSGAPMTGPGTLSLACDGGMPGDRVSVCVLPLARPLRLSGAQELAYEIYLDPALTRRFAVQDQGQAVFDVTLDTRGAARQDLPLHAGITTPRAQVGAGRYTASPALSWRVGTGAGCATGSQGTAAYAVSAEVVKRCTVLAGQDVDFGTLDPTAAAWTAQGALDVTCTRGVAYTIELGAGSSGRPDARTMRKGADVLPYGLYMDSGTSRPWGAGSSKGGVGTGSADRHPVFGRILAATLPRAGDYADEVIVTVRY